MVRYYNLTQALPFTKPNSRLCYFRSTDVEQKNYERLLWSVPDEMLYHLARGQTVEIVDASRHKRGKIEKIFVPVLCDLLRSVWFGQRPRNKQLLDHYARALNTLLTNKLLLAKFSFWKDFCICNEVKLVARTIHITAEKNYEKLFGGDQTCVN